MKHTIRSAAHAAAALIAAALVVGYVGTAFAAAPPHVPDSDSTDSCAMCHRTHTANTGVSYRSTDTTETTGTSLLISPDPARGDVSLCLTCHGVGQLGSNSDVETSFLRSSVHSLAPTSSPYGPDPIMCSTCHDPHGSDRTPGGTTWPALLRSFSLESTTPVFTGEAYCATCHTVQSDLHERWAGLDVYEQTGHFNGFPMPATGTGIRCSICHDPHGSNVAPLLVGSLVPTSVASTFTVTADDRTFCIACHPNSDATWSGGATYATSAHALSSKTVAIAAQWVPAGQRKVGECQVCHAPMGRSDGAGGAIPKLLDAKGRVLCDRCHSAGGPASTDTSSQARPLRGALTLAAVYAPGSGVPGVVSLYGRASTGSGPLSGPRQYAPPDGTGPSAVGDVDGDGKPELVVASADGPLLTIYRTDPLRGVSLEATFAISAQAKAIAVANVVDALVFGTDVPEIAVVGADGNLHLYDVSGSSPLLSVPAGPFAVGSTGPWAMTAGDVTGTVLPDLVVTDENGGTGGSLYVITDSGTHTAVSTSIAIGGAPVAPSIGDVWSGASGKEIVVCDAVAVTDNVRVLNGSGSALATYTVSAAAGSPTASVVGDLLPAVPREEVAIAFSDAVTGSSSVVVLPQASPGPGLDVSTPLLERTSGAGTHTGSLIAGDVDGDGHTDLVAGNGGTWATSAASAPSVDIWRADGAGTSLVPDAEHLVGGGAELAGSAPALALADLGPIFPSRHPIDEASAAHVSTETAPFDRHVTCADCHNSHEAVEAVTSAPAIQGLLRGAWGVGVSYVGTVPAFAAAGPAADSYQLCFKCHSSNVALSGRPDTAVEFGPATASRHAVEAESTSTIPVATFVGAWSESSVLYCTDCHGDDGAAGAAARDLHESASAPILAKPYAGTDPAAGSLLCYTCHLYAVYADGTTDAPTDKSWFQETSPNVRTLHSYHVAGTGGQGVSCSACHVSHGSVTEPHLLRDDIGFTSTGDHSGTCTNACHTGTAHTWGTP